MKKLFILMALIACSVSNAQAEYEKIAITENVKQNGATRIIVQDSVTKELNWVLKGSLTVPDATTTAKGKIKLAGDLGGTADLPTTPTAVHKTGSETISGEKQIVNSSVTPSRFLFFNESSAVSSALTIDNSSTTQPAIKIATSSNGTTGAVINQFGSSSTGMLIEPTQNNPQSTARMLVLSNKLAVNGVVDTSTPLTVLRNNVSVASISDQGIINGAGLNVTGNAIAANPTASNHLVTKSYADGLVVGLLDDRGSYNASTNLFPSTGGSGTGGAVLKGDLWYVSVAGTLGGKAVAIGDSFRALVDTPAQVAANWSVLSSNLSYVPANDANVLHTAGNLAESITGIKTFQNIISIDGAASGLNFATTSGYTGSATPFLNNRGGFLTLVGSTGGTGGGGLGLSFDTSLIQTTAKKVQFQNKDGIVAYTSDLPVNPITGTGTANYLPKFTASGTQAISQVFDNGTNVGIGTNSPNTKLDVNGIISATGISNTYTAIGVTAIFNAMQVSSSFNSSGDNNLDAPFSSEFYFLESFKYDSASFGMQRITYFTGSVAGRMFIRTKALDTWSSWVEK